MDLLKGSPELIAEYLNFLLDFSWSPAKAFAPYLTAPPSPAPRVSFKLLAFCLMSVSAAALIAHIGAAAGMLDDHSPILARIDKIDQWQRPFAALLVLVAFTVVLHVVSRLANVIFAKLEGWGHIGSVHDSVNALMGFASWCLLVFTSCIIGLRVLLAHTTVEPRTVLFVMVLPLSIAFLGYLTAAFAAAHRISLVHAWLLLSVTLFLFCVIADKLLS